MKSKVATILIAAAGVCVPAGAMSDERGVVYAFVLPVAGGGANDIRCTDRLGLFTDSKKISFGEASA